MPTDARYCPNCGLAATGAVHLLDLGAPSEDERPGPPPPPDRTWSTVAGVILGAIGLIAALSVIAGTGSDEDTAADDPSNPTTSPPTSATTLPTPGTADDLQLITGGDLLDPSLGLAAVWLRSNGTVVVADLATGEETVLVDELPVRPVQAARWTGDLFLIQGVRPGLHVLHPASGESWITIDTDDHWVDPYGPSAGPLVHLWPSDLSEGGSEGHWGRVLPSGELQIFDTDISPPMGRVALVDGRLALDTGGAIYLVAPDGTARRHAFGALLGAGDRHLVRQRCDEVLECDMVVDDLETDAEVSMGPLSLSVSVLAAVPAPDGMAVVVLRPGERSVDLEVRTPGGEVVELTPEGIGQWSGEPGAIAWAADGSGLFWIDESGPTLQVLRWAGGSPDPEPTVVELTPRARHGAGYERVVVVPLDELPSSWRPSSDG